ncbi:hypothetical protein MBLNU230_g7441t1 [Neophaeotheca triangularis]
MARLSKSPFTIYDDEPTASHGATAEDHSEASWKEEGDTTAGKEDEGHFGASCVDLRSHEHDPSLDKNDPLRLEDVYPATDGQGENDLTLVEDDRRISTQTRATVSTLPESDYETEAESQLDHTDSPAAKRYTPPIMRPSFRRPESVHRMQMTSPPPLDRYSPRHSSVLRNTKSRTSTPRSIRSARGGEARSSPRPRTRPHAPLDSETEGEREEKSPKTQDLPLVLLHVTLLPVGLPWSYESMRNILPSHVWENLQLLRARASDTVVRRGVLIPHPREEYELLEERLLEALELKTERVTKCGHFRSRESLESSLSEKSVVDSDSGVGSSLSGSEGSGACTTCHRRIKSETSAVGGGRGKWSVKVFAANGLMRAAAWAAAWNDMERVDVEILPWIDEAVRKKLDERRGEEDAEEREQRKGDSSRVQGLVEEQVRLAYESKQLDDERRRHFRAASNSSRLTQPLAATRSASQSQHLEPSPPLTESKPDGNAQSSGLPRVYQPSQVPLSLLLKNYLLLQLKDRRTVAILFCSVLALLFALRGFVTAVEPSHLSPETTLGDASAPLPSVFSEAPRPMQTVSRSLPVSWASTAAATEVLNSSTMETPTARPADAVPERVFTEASVAELKAASHAVSDDDVAGPMVDSVAEAVDEEQEGQAEV